MIAYAQWLPSYWVFIYVGIGWCIRAAMVPTVLRREFAPGAAIAWLGIVFLHPYIGLATYMAIGETRLGKRRAQRHQDLVKQFRAPAQDSTEVQQPRQIEPSYRPMVLQVEKLSRMPPIGGNAVDFLANSTEMIDRLVADIDAARGPVHLLYYIFFPDATGLKVVVALENAARRGVKCRVLVDAVASHVFLRSGGLSHRLRSAGVETAAALPVDPLKRRLPRMDLRNHRKLAIIDGGIAYVGSQNLINADYGGRCGGPWVDLTARYTGPIVGELAMVFMEDWAFETGKELDPPTIENLPSPDAEIAAQAVPTGPDVPDHGFRKIILAAIQCARERLILTTPYFVPDDTTLVSLIMAADRGVDVSLIVPLVGDQRFAGMAGRAHYGRLLAAGVKIFQFRPGLIHSKTTTVDDAVAIVGSANLDVRSFNLNFELSVLLYGARATCAVREIQEKYLADSEPIDAAAWAKRPMLRQYLERAVSLLSPLL